MANAKKNFWKYITLSILGMLGSSGTILADTFFISNRLGADGLAALNLSISVFGLMNGLGLLFGVGGATRYATFQSQKEDHRANQAFTRSFLLALFFGMAGINPEAVPLQCGQRLRPGGSREFPHGAGQSQLHR